MQHNSNKNNKKGEIEEKEISAVSPEFGGKGMTNKRVHVFYSGHVQGIGFRYTAQDIAMSLGLTGWVKNLEDGRVEVVAEGNEKDIKEFLDKVLKGQLGRYIADAELLWEKPAREFDSFEIVF